MALYVKCQKKLYLYTLEEPRENAGKSIKIKINYLATKSMFQFFKFIAVFTKKKASALAQERRKSSTPLYIIISTPL